MKKFFGILFTVFCSTLLWAQIKIISPVPGTWANKQMLLIDTEDGADYFYSLNGENPEVAGFAYDGPVLIDLTGDITVKVTRGFEERTEIKFSVEPYYPEENDCRTFVYSFFETGILNYFSGSEINIPSKLRYTFELNPENYNLGKKLSYSEKCSLTRFLPCTVTDGNHFWRFIIRANPKSTGSFSRRDLPFSIVNWNEIVFEDPNLLFRIDNEYWNLPSASRVLDRTVSHVIYWQDIAFDVGNPVEFYELPPLPELKSVTNSNGSVSFFLEGDDSYSMTISQKDYPFYELYTELVADTFSGDYINENLDIAVYSDSVYQGVLHTEYEVDKRLPSYPVFKSSSPTFHARGTVNLNVMTSPGADLYVAVSEPLVLEDSDYSKDSPFFNSVYPADFTRYASNADLILQSNSDKPVYYKVLAYSVSADMKSDISEYSVIIDSYTFYFDADADPAVANGSKEHPFTNFKQSIDLMGKYRSVNLILKGKISMPEGKTDMDINCDIKGTENAVIEFPANSYLVVRNSTLQLSNVRITKNSSSARSGTAALIKLENSVLSIDNSEIVYSGNRNATFVDGVNSVIRIADSAATVTAQVYSSFVSSLNTRLTIRNSRIAIVGDTSVAVSSRDSKATCENSSFRVTGILGRIAEFFNTEGYLNNNAFSADLKRGTGSVQPVFCDENSKITEVSNRVQGF
ncbi:MAG: chitobiase/beta-hexosaminidase C-terminal domain-containing protein [Treponema sp.]|nr:chitobiase/beta-hexosaminidase C-terminal domain-containing protein [Treponema sp.]